MKKFLLNVGSHVLGTLHVDCDDDDDDDDDVQRYEKYLSHEQQMLISLDSECQESRTFERIYREFEAQKVCYLPINAFLLKPAQRLLHYQLIINSQLMLSSHCRSMCALY